MAQTRKIGTAVGIALALLLSASSASAATSTAGHFRYAIGYNPAFSALSTSAQRNGYVVLPSSKLSQMRQMKAADPNLKVLLYKDLSGSRNDCTATDCVTGVSYQEADTQHPDWFLLNKQGQRITFNDYQQVWAMDVGSAGYQNRWADNVLTEVNRDGWDGVFLDDTNLTMAYHYSVSNVAKYPSDSAYQAATQSALANIGPRIQADGKLAVANIGGWPDYPTVGNSWLSYLSGAMEEHLGKWGNTTGSGYADQGTWQTELSNLKYAQAHGKIFLGNTTSANGDQAAARYGWATTLLASQGKAEFSLSDDTYTSENWFPEYDYDIGDPTGAESTDSNGVHRRVFSKGIVVVNSTAGQLSANLGGTYSGSGLTNVSSVSLAPHSAYVLTASATSPPPPPPPTTYMLTVSVAGNGSVTGTGIHCPGDCSQAYESGTVVNLTTTLASGSTFSGWGGSCSGTGACSVTMGGVKSVSASFITPPPKITPPPTTTPPPTITPPPTTTPPPTSRPSGHRHKKQKRHSKTRLRKRKRRAHRS